MEQTYGKASLSEGDVEDRVEALAKTDNTKTDVSEMGALSFMRRIRYFSDGVLLGSKSFCEDKFNEFRSYFQTKRDRTGKLISTKHKKKKVSAPEGNLLHLHSIRSFTRLDL